MPRIRITEGSKQLKYYKKKSQSQASKVVDLPDDVEIPKTNVKKKQHKKDGKVKGTDLEWGD